jgi:diphthine synthase
MFHLIGLGLNPPGSIPADALATLRAADTVYLETYTNLGITPQALAQHLGRDVLPAPRTTVESDAVLAHATDRTVALAVIGDIFTATTHSVLYLECLERGIPVTLHPNAGIMNAIGVTGLELYKFGETVSVPYPLPSYDPTLYVGKLRANRDRGLHTLALLDIKADEGRYMTVAEGIAELLRKKAIDAETLVIGCARVGTDRILKAGLPADVATFDFGPQPHCIVVPGNLNALETDFIARWRAVR